MKVQRCKGSRDLSPGEMSRFRLIEETFRRSCLAAGYEEVKTPTVEYLHLFTATGTLTPAKLSQVYSFLDWDGWSGERVVLRPDSTIPAARLYIDSLGAPVRARLYYVQNIFRFEPTGQDSRENWQCGVEFIGGQGAIADAEIIFMAVDTLKALGIRDIEIQLSHAGFIKALLSEIEPDPAKQVELFDSILDGNTDSLKRAKGDRSGLDRVLSLLLNFSGRADGFLRNLKAIATGELPTIRPALEDFARVAELLSPLNGDFKLNIASGRGFEYYTGIMLQFNSSGLRIGGGGRYDDLIPLIGGQKVPACGFALYVDRLGGLVKLPVSTQQRRLKITVSPPRDSNSAIAASLDLCRRLRDSGYIAVMETDEYQAADAWASIYIQNKGDKVIFSLAAKGKKRRPRFRTVDGLMREVDRLGQAGAA